MSFELKLIQLIKYLQHIKFLKCTFYKSSFQIVMYMLVKSFQPILSSLKEVSLRISFAFHFAWPLLALVETH